MAFDLFQDENIAVGLAADAQFQQGVSDFDAEGTTVEQKVLIPAWPRDPRATWIYYDVNLACYLDSGIVVHAALPQTDPLPDALWSMDIDDLTGAKITNRGANLKSNARYQDTVQRMAHSRYWFRLYGEALRVAYEVPIPGIVKIAGVDAVPHDNNPQLAESRIIGNYSGVPYYYARWSLWYTTYEAPKKNQDPPQNLAVHIAASVQLPDGYQAPFSAPDDEAKKAEPPNDYQMRNPLADGG